MRNLDEKEIKKVKRILNANKNANAEHAIWFIEVKQMGQAKQHTLIAPTSKEAVIQALKKGRGLAFSLEINTKYAGSVSELRKP